MYQGKWGLYPGVSIQVTAKISLATSDLLGEPRCSSGVQILGHSAAVFKAGTPSEYTG